MTRHDDVLYLGHIPDCTRHAQELLHGVSRQEFDASLMLRLAMRHLIQTVGEAARRVPDATRAEHPEIPWQDIVGMRHRIVHDYIDVDDALVRDVATGDLQRLRAMIEPLVPPDMREPPQH